MSYFTSYGISGISTLHGTHLLCNIIPDKCPVHPIPSHGTDFPYLMPSVAITRLLAPRGSHAVDEWRSFVTNSPCHGGDIVLVIQWESSIMDSEHQAS